jgi:Ca2+/Na+ antiporter
MITLLKEIRHNPLLWLLVFVPVVFIADKAWPEAHTLLFVLSVLAIVPLAGLLSHATESVAVKTGDAVGGLLNATLGNLTELVIALAALRVGQTMLVKASIAGAIVTNTLFMLGASFLLGGIKHHTQEYNRVSARLQAGLLFLATIALLVPSAIAEADSKTGTAFTNKLSVGLAVLLIAAYGLGMLFSLKTHREFFGSVTPGEEGEEPWPIGLALATLAGVTVFVALVSEIFVESVQEAAVAFGMTPAFVGLHRCSTRRRGGRDGFGIFRCVQEPARPECRHRAWERLPDRALRGAGTRAAQLHYRTRAHGSAILAGSRGNDADRHPHHLTCDQHRSLGVVSRRARADGLPDLRPDAVFTATWH